MAFTYNLLFFLTQLFEVDDRINHSKAPAIAVRYLRVRSSPLDEV